TTVTTMNSEALVKERSSPPILIGMSSYTSNWWIGSTLSGEANFKPRLGYRARRMLLVVRSLGPILSRCLLRHQPGRTQHIHDSRTEPEEKKYDHPPGRCAGQTVDQPANRRPNQYGGHELARTPQSRRHAGTASHAFRPGCFRIRLRLAGQRLLQNLPAPGKFVIGEPWPAPVGSFGLVRHSCPRSPSPAPDSRSVGCRFKVGRTIVSALAPVKPRTAILTVADIYEISIA